LSPFSFDLSVFSKIEAAICEQNINIELLFENYLEFMGFLSNFAPLFNELSYKIVFSKWRLLINIRTKSSEIV
jgi:hypothetical protein